MIKSFDFYGLPTRAIPGREGWTVLIDRGAKSVSMLVKVHPGAKLSALKTQLERELAIPLRGGGAVAFRSATPAQRRRWIQGKV